MQPKVGGPLRSRVKSDVLLPGRVELAKWALAEGGPWRESGALTCLTATMASKAARCGHLELTQWLVKEHQAKYPALWPPKMPIFSYLAGRVIIEAAAGGNVELVEWLLAEGIGQDICRDQATVMCAAAAEHGHLEVLRWARENGYLSRDRSAVCAQAAHGGHLEILQWLHANRCCMCKATCEEATYRYDVEMLRWARENGCEWTAHVRDKAAEELGYTDDKGGLVVAAEDHGGCWDFPD